MVEFPPPFLLQEFVELLQKIRSDGIQKNLCLWYVLRSVDCFLAKIQLLSRIFAILFCFAIFIMKMEIISFRGYPVEAHDVVTSDGYILELHRIPGNNNRTDLQKKGRPVFIQHGLMDTSGRFVATSMENSIGLIYFQMPHFLA